MVTKNCHEVKDRGICSVYLEGLLWDVKYFSLGWFPRNEKRGQDFDPGENKPEIFWAELGVQAVGNMVEFLRIAPPEVKFYVTDSDSTLSAHDQEQVDNSSDQRGPSVSKKVIYWDSKGLWNYDDPSWSVFLNDPIGKDYEKNILVFWGKYRNGRRGDCSDLLYSGTTGLPKGAMISHGGWSPLLMLAWSRSWSDNDRYVSFIPPGWIASRPSVSRVNWSQAWRSFPEEPETVQENIREIDPVFSSLLPAYGKYQSYGPGENHRYLRLRRWLTIPSAHWL